jgi:hypothetical protein
MLPGTLGAPSDPIADGVVEFASVGRGAVTENSRTLKFTSQGFEKE